MATGQSRAMTKEGRLAVGAAAVLQACGDDNLRDLSADDRAVALDGRQKAWGLLLATGITPTELKALGLAMIGEAVGL